MTAVPIADPLATQHWHEHGPVAPKGAGGTREAACKVFLLEDHEMFRTQVARLIAKDPRRVVCGESESASQALEMIETAKPDMVIVDVTLKGMNGLDFIRELRSRGSRALILVLSMHDESMYAERALKAGANGYLTKHQASSHLQTAIERLLGGEVYLSPQMTNHLLQKLAGNEPAPDARDFGSLTPREIEIFRLIGQGFSTRDIALALELGEKTVHSHRFQIKAKLGVKHSAELYNLAARWGEDRSKRNQVGIAPD